MHVEMATSMPSLESEIARVRASRRDQSSQTDRAWETIVAGILEYDADQATAA